MNFPAELKYSKDHEWVRVEGDTAFIGITDFAQDQLGDIVFVDVQVEVDDKVEKDSTFGAIEAVKTVADGMMPITGTVLEINEELQDAPETVNSDPYGKGWMLKVKIENPAELDELMNAADYQATCK